MSKLLAKSYSGPLGVWARISLDSGELVFISVASATVRFHSMKKPALLGTIRPDKILYEISTSTAYLKHSQAPTPFPPGELDTPEKRTADFLGWLTSIAMAVPSIDALRVALPLLIGDDRA